MPPDMHVEIEWNGGPQDVTVRATGRATLAGSLGLVADVVGDPRFRPGTRVLIDYRRLDGGRTTVPEVDALASEVARRGEALRGTVVAVVVGSPVDYGLTRMWQQVASGRTELEVGVFFELGEALEWLARHAPAPPSG